MSKYQGDKAFMYIFSYILFAFIIMFKAFFSLRKFNIIHYNNLPDFPVFSFGINKLFGTKIILDSHDSIHATFISKFNKKENSFIIKLLKIEEKISSRFADFNITAVHRQNQDLISYGVNKNEIFTFLNIPHPVLFPPNRFNKRHKFDNLLKIMFHGTLAKRLGLEIAIESARIIKENNLNFKFYIIGEGDYLKELKRLSELYKLNNFIYFSEKYISVEEIPELINEMDVGIIPYKNNYYNEEYTLPVKLIEYVCAGIPVIAPDFKSIRYYFSEDMIFYYTPEDPLDLAEKIFKVYEYKKLLSGPDNKGKSFFDAYSFKMQAERYKEILSKLINDT